MATEETSAEARRKTPSGDFPPTAEIRIRVNSRGLGFEFLKKVASKLGIPTLAVLASLVAGYFQRGDVTQTAEKVAEEAAVKAEETAKSSYQKLAKPTNDLGTRVNDMEKSMADVAAALQLLLAQQPGFTADGKPATAGAAPRRHRRPAPELVKRAEKAAEKLPEIQAKADAPAPQPVPLELKPAEASKPKTAPGEPPKPPEPKP